MAETILNIGDIVTLANSKHKKEPLGTVEKVNRYWNREQPWFDDIRVRWHDGVTNVLGAYNLKLVATEEQQQLENPLLNWIEALAQK